jgi:hypothetical protein
VQQSNGFDETWEFVRFHGPRQVNGRDAQLPEGGVVQKGAQGVPKGETDDAIQAWRDTRAHPIPPNGLEFPSVVVVMPFVQFGLTQDRFSSLQEFSGIGYDFVSGA